MSSIGIAEGDTFAVMLRNSPTLIEIMLAARQIGAYFVLLNWHFKANEAGYILRDTEQDIRHEDGGFQSAACGRRGNWIALRKVNA